MVRPRTRTEDVLHDWAADLADALTDEPDALIDQLESATLTERATTRSHRSHSAGGIAPERQQHVAAPTYDLEWPRPESNGALLVGMTRMEIKSCDADSEQHRIAACHTAPVMAPPLPTHIGCWQANALPPRRQQAPLRGLRSALRVQERAMCAAKLRGLPRRGIAKGSRRETHERVRRLLPIAALDERDAAARRGRDAVHDARLARLALALTL